MISSPDDSQNPLSITVNLLNDLFSLIWTETIFMSSDRGMAPSKFIQKFYIC